MKKTSWETTKDMIASLGRTCNRKPIKDGTRALVTITFTKRLYLDEISASVFLHLPDCYWTSNCPRNQLVRPKLNCMDVTVVRKEGAWIIERINEAEFIYHQMLQRIDPPIKLIDGYSVCKKHYRARSLYVPGMKRNRVYNLDFYEQPYRYMFYT